mgnify:CR=1 FL=1
MDDSTKEPEVTEETVEAAPEEEVEKDTKRDTKRDTKKDASAPDDKPAAARKGLSTPVWVALVVVALVVGVLGGHFLLGGIGGSSLSGKTTLSEDQLDSVMGTYTYKGQVYNITVQDVLDATSSQNQANADGTYNLPSSDGVLSVARTRILVKAADDQGITVSDDELSQFAQQYTGTSDLDQLASNYGISADKIKQQVSDAAKVSKLRDSVISTTLPDVPAAPTAPSDGNKDATSKDYADYIISLVGSEWDANTGTWAATDGPYATALASYTITSDSASYNAAMAAYAVAAQKYQVAAQQVSQDWTNYVNGLLCNASISVFSLVA